MNEPTPTPAQGLLVTWRAEADGAVVHVHGEVDMDTAPALDEALRDASEAESTALVVDLHDVQFLGSSGLGVLLVWHRRCAARGTPLALVALPHAITRVIAITGLDRIFTVLPSLAAWSAEAARLRANSREADKEDD